MRSMNPELIIDAGHGGSDPGASGNGLIEKVFTLMFSLYQYTRFTELGVPSALTRDSDITVGNVLRAEKVKNSGAKYCISNHLNAAASTSAKGVEVIHSIYNNGQLAHAIVDALAAEGLPKRSNPVYCKQYPSDSKKDYYYMHRWTGNVQTNIIEYDFLTNADGARRIEENWERYAEAVVKVYCSELGYAYTPPKKHVEKDIILEWAENQGYDISKASEKLTYRELWEILYRLLEPSDKIKDKKEVIEVNRSVLKLGSKGEDVKLLQQLLGITADGTFGPQTQSVVIAFQKVNGLAADGIVGPATWGLFDKQSEKTVSSTYYEHYKISLTDVVEVDPLKLKISIQDKPGNQINLANFVTSGYQYGENGKLWSVSILASEGKIIRPDAPRGPKGTLIVYKNGTVDVKSIEDIRKEKDVWFAVSGCSILPKILMKEEGFTGAFADIGRETDRPVIGWNPTKKKIIIAVRPSSNIARGQATLQNLGCTKGITLDGGGSTILKVGGKLIKSTARRLYSVITW